MDGYRQNAGLLQRVAIELGRAWLVTALANRISAGFLALRGLPSLFSATEVSETNRKLLKCIAARAMSKTAEIFRTEGNLVLMDTLNMIQQDYWREGRPPRIDMPIQLWLEKPPKSRKVLTPVDFCGACELEELEPGWWWTDEPRILVNLPLSEQTWDDYII